MNNARTIYAQKTVEGRGAPRQMDDTSKIEGYMVNNGDGTYSKYSPDGKLMDTFAAPGDFMSELGRNAGAIADDRSGVIGKFILPAVAMGYGANMVNGGIAGMEGAAAAEAGGAGGGLMGAESMAVPELATPTYSLAGGTGTLGSASAGSTGAAMGGATGLGGASTAAGTGLAGLLGSKAGVLAAGGLLGLMAGKDTTTTQNSSKDPWGPAQPYLLDNLKTNAAMQKYYQENPFSNEQKAAYQNVFNANANGMANAPVMSGIANNFMQSNRGRMAAMPSFIQGTQAAPVNWDAYRNIGVTQPLNAAPAMGVAATTRGLLG